MTNLSITKASFWPVKCWSMGIGGWDWEPASLDFQASWRIELGQSEQNPQTPGLENGAIETTLGLGSRVALALHELSRMTSFCGRATYMPSTCLHPHLVSLQPFLGTWQLTPWSWWARRPTTVERDVSPQNMCIRWCTTPSLATNLGMWPSHRLIKCLDQGRTTDAWVPYPGVSLSVLKCLTGEGAPVFCYQQMQLKFKSMDVHLIPLSFNYFELEVSVRHSSIYIPW